MDVRAAGLGLLASALLIGTAADAARSRPADPPGSEALRPVFACRAIAKDQDRLACYDQAARTLEEASARHDVVVVDQQAVTQARRSLFGFSMPTLDIFRSARPDDAAESEITSTIRAAQRDADGNWVVTIEDGAVWHQTGGIVGGTVRPGEKVVIKRASLGSYFMRLGSRPGVKARREG